MSILTSLTLPLAASTARSSAGPSVLQGPHQVAQKSTITGWMRDSSTTSLAKPASVPSLIKSPAVVSPIRDIPSPRHLVLVRLQDGTRRPPPQRRRASHRRHGVEVDDQGLDPQ